MLPGGGVGAFDACSSQWGVNSSELGQQYGGFLATCRSQNPGANLTTIKNCVRGMCNNVFDDPWLAELNAGCNFFVDWYESANNPEIRFAEVQCPQAIISKTGMSK